MNKVETYKKLVDRAIRNGWTAFGLNTHSDFKWHVYERLNSKELIFSVSFQLQGTMFRDFSFETVVFDHEFISAIYNEPDELIWMLYIESLARVEPSKRLEHLGKTALGGLS